MSRDDDSFSYYDYICLDMMKILVIMLNNPQLLGSHCNNDL